MERRLVAFDCWPADPITPNGRYWLSCEWHHKYDNVWLIAMKYFKNELDYFSCWREVDTEY